MLPDKLSFIDVETTGGSATQDRIIEIGIIRVEGGQVVETFSSLINPEGSIPHAIETLTGITNDDVANAPTFGHIKQDIALLLQDCVFVAHNVRFDYSFIKNEFRREEISYAARQLCTVKLARALYPGHQHYNLDSIIDRFGFTCENRHRAQDDANVLVKLYETMLAQFPHEQVAAAIDIVMRKPTVPLHLPADALSALPESPGVYIFYGAQEIPLYVGKSINVKTRVQSHFSQDHASMTEMHIVQQVERIETKQTVGEFGALVLEAQLVKQLQPLYNKKLRRTQNLCIVTREETELGYATVGLQNISVIDDSLLDRIIAIVKTRRQAKALLEYAAQSQSLCKKLLGLEQFTSSCFGYRLGTCRGACVAIENPALYNARFALAFDSTKINSWPYAGPVVLIEKDPLSGDGEAYIVDQWRILAVVSFTDFAQDFVDVTSYTDKLRESEVGMPFDLDTYKLIKSSLYKPGRHMTITRLDKQSELARLVHNHADLSYIEP